MSGMVHRQEVVTTRGAPSRLSEEGSATVMVRVKGLKWFGVNAASVLCIATPCKRRVEIWCVFVTPEWVTVEREFIAVPEGVLNMSITQREKH